MNGQVCAYLVLVHILQFLDLLIKRKGIGGVGGGGNQLHCVKSEKCSFTLYNQYYHSLS